MESLISAYASYGDAARTIENLRDAGYSENRLLLIRRDDIVNNNIRVKPDGRIAKAELVIVTLLGATAGILFETGTVAIPGIHFAHQSSLWMAIAIGLAFGFLAAEILSLITGMIIDEVNAVKYRQLIEESKFLVFVQGDKEEINKAEQIAHAQLHLELFAH